MMSSRLAVLRSLAEGTGYHSILRDNRGKIDVVFCARNAGVVESLLKTLNEGGARIYSMVSTSEGPDSDSYREEMESRGVEEYLEMGEAELLQEQFVALICEFRDVRAEVKSFLEKGNKALNESVRDDLTRLEAEMKEVLLDSKKGSPDLPRLSSLVEQIKIVRKRSR